MLVDLWAAIWSPSVFTSYVLPSARRLAYILTSSTSEVSSSMLALDLTSF